MCRLLAIPSGFTRDEALTILLDMQAQKNRDGVGSVYVDDKGQFQIVKYPKSLSHVLRKHKPFLDHLPHKGWTLIHLRAASHGGHTMENTHPFEVGDWCVAHNGIWHEHALASVLMEKLGGIHMVGQTDSEVAAHFLNIVGPDRFTEELDYAGTFIGLKRDGTLYVMKTSGDLEALERGKQVVLSSEFDFRHYRNQEHYTLMTGWYQFSPDGKILHKEPMKWKMPVTKGVIQGRAFSSYEDDGEALFDREFAEPFIIEGPSKPVKSTHLHQPARDDLILDQDARDKMEEQAAYDRFLAYAMLLKRGPAAMGIVQGPNVGHQHIDPLMDVVLTGKAPVDMSKYQSKKRGCRRGLPPSRDPLILSGD